MSISTSQDAPIALRVSGDGRTLQQLLVHVSTRCDDGNSGSWSGAASFAAFKPPTIPVGKSVCSPARVSRRGSFRATGVATDGYADQLGMVTQTLRGSVRRGVAAGPTRPPPTSPTRAARRSRPAGAAPCAGKPAAHPGARTRG